MSVVPIGCIRHAERADTVVEGLVLLKDEHTLHGIRVEHEIETFSMISEALKKLNNFDNDAGKAATFQKLKEYLHLFTWTVFRTTELLYMLFSRSEHFDAGDLWLSLTAYMDDVEALPPLKRAIAQCKFIECILGLASGQRANGPMCEHRKTLQTLVKKQNLRPWHYRTPERRRYLSQRRANKAPRRVEYNPFRAFNPFRGQILPNDLGIAAAQYDDPNDLDILDPGAPICTPSKRGRTDMRNPVTIGYVEKTAILASLWNDTSAAKPVSISALSSITHLLRCTRAWRMRWWHMYRKQMSFDEFRAAAQHITHLSNEEVLKVSELLNSVQWRHERPGAGGRLMTPNFSQSHSVDSGIIAFISLPYIFQRSVDADTPQSSDWDLNYHATRTLLQRHFNTKTRRRDLAQAASTLPETRGDFIHVSDIWMLLVESDNTGSIVLTCTDRLLESLQADLDLYGDEASEELDVEVRGPEGRSWLIPVGPTTSLPSFLSMFGDRTRDTNGPSSPARMLAGNELVTFAAWKSILEERSSVHRILQLEVTTDKDRALTIESFLDTLIDDFNIDRSGMHHAQVFSRRSATSSQASMPDALLQAHSYLSLGQYSAEYARQPMKLCADVDMWLEAALTESQGRKLDIRKRADAKLAIALMARYVAGFFWSLNVRHVMIDRYWGALWSSCVNGNELDDLVSRVGSKRVGRSMAN